ncbi:MAG: LysR family transcriptional regulator, partial [Planctomycetaceae bacterium]|nr:LysR family transcriptional regulator [Planctomycetaceae bacterium]
MDPLNHRHLHCFWAVAREGSLRRASERVLLSPQTLSGQVRLLERALGRRLFERRGRGLVLTPDGRTVFRTADEIFSLDRDLREALAGGASGRPQPVAVGISDGIPKLVVRRLLEPLLRLPVPVALLCREDDTGRLLGALALHELDFVLSDHPVPPSSGFRAFSHLLVESRISFFAAGPLARRLRKGFPGSLRGAPVLLPTGATALRRSLDAWFEERGIRPSVVAEFDDSALMKSFGERGHGAFPVPSIVDDEARRVHGAVRIGVAEGVR